MIIFLPFERRLHQGVVGYAGEQLHEGDFVTVEMTQDVPPELAKTEPEAFLMAKRRPIPILRKAKA